MSTSLTVGLLAEHLGAELAGDSGSELYRAAPLESASEGEVSFLARRKYLPYLSATRATAVLVSRGVGELEVVPRGTALLWVDDAHAALAETLTLLYPETRREGAIAPTAVLEPGVELGEDVGIGPHTVVGAGAKLGDGVRIGANCVIGEGCELGAGTEINNLVCVYPDTVIGVDCIIHSGAQIGVDGFGYVVQEDGYLKIPQVGRCVIEDNVEIGANTCIDRGSVGETRIGAGTKIDNLVHIAHNVSIGRSSIIVAQVGIAGSTTVGDGVAIGGQVGIIDHLNIGDRAKIAAGSGIGEDVPAGETWFGFPARQRTQAMRASLATLKLPQLIRRVQRLEKLLNVDEDT